MAPVESEIPGWLNLLTRLWPVLLFEGALIAGAMELRVRKMLRKGIENAINDSEEKGKKALTDCERAWDFKWRTEAQKPIGDIGIDALEAHKRIDTLETRINVMEPKVKIFWDMVERETVNLLRRGRGEDS